MLSFYLRKQTQSQEKLSFPVEDAGLVCVCFTREVKYLTCLLFPGTAQLNHHKVRLAGGGDGVGYAAPQTWGVIPGPMFY